MKDFFEKNKLITIWVIASLGYALFIHILFSVQAFTTWTVAKWSAGEILTYVSTVSLGLLAVWQNNRFKEENDAAQARLEQLVKQSNELSAINKIIEIEFERYNQIIKAFDLFSKKCDPQTIATTHSDNISNFIDCISSMVKLENEIDQSFFQMARVLRIDTSLVVNDQDPLKKAMVAYYLLSKETVQKLQKTPQTDASKEIDGLIILRKDFIEQREQYIHVLQDKLKRVVYENMTLEEIKKVYNSEV